ncbi:MAG: LysR family transcriptional regulator [Pseudomonadota bacterium]
MKIETIDRIDLRTLICFERVAVLGSFAAAGRQLDMPRAAVSRVILQLEEQVGTKLFQRTTRSVTLTHEGRALAEAAGPALSDLRIALIETKTTETDLRGSVSFSVSQAFGRRFVLPALSTFREAFPEVRIEMMTADNLEDLVVQGLDFTIRLGELPDSSLVSRKLAEVEIVLAVPKSLLKGHPPPKVFADLAGLPAIGFRIPGTRSMYRWDFRKRGEVFSKAPDDASVITDSVDDVASLVAQGAGVSPVPRYLVEDLIASGDIVVGLAGYRIPSIPAHLCFPGRGKRPKRVEALVPHLATHIKRALG